MWNLKYFVIIILCCGSLNIQAQKYSGDSWEKIKSSGSGTLACIYYESPGIIYKDLVTNKLKGLSVDIINDFVHYIKEKYSKTVNVVYVGQEQIFPEFLKHVNDSPNLLGVCNVSITAARKKHYSFTPSFLKNIFVLVSHTSAPSITKLSELKNKFAGYKASMITGSIQLSIMQLIKEEHFPSLVIEKLPSSDEILEKISTNPKLFTLVDYTQYIFAAKNKLAIKRQSVKIPVPEDELGFVMQKGSDWAPLWEEFLTPEYKNSIEYKKSIAENLGKAFLNITRE